MIQKLRRHFIIIAITSTLAVLAVIIGTLNIVSYRDMVKRIDGIIEVLASNNGRFPDHIINKNRNMKGDLPPNQKFFLRETPYETRFFWVLLDDRGNISQVDMGRIASAGEEEAQEYAKEVLSRQVKYDRDKGFLNDYRYMISDQEGEKLIIFMDASKELQSVRKVLLFSSLISAIGLVAVFLLVVIFSRLVFRPVERSYQKQKQFITDASHELKTPLTIVSANVEVIEMEWEENEWTKSVKHQLDRMVHMVEQMVNLSRMDEETERIRESFSLSEALRDTGELFLPVAERKGKKIELSIQDGISLMGDEKQIRQLIGLLLDNGVKYAAGSGEAPSLISLKLVKKGRKAEILVKNTVEEMGQGNYDVLFERFYRLDSSRNSKTGGAGIGLSIAKSIVEGHRGRITAYSRDGHTLEILVTLPLI